MAMAVDALIAPSGAGLHQYCFNFVILAPRSLVVPGLANRVMPYYSSIDTIRKHFMRASPAEAAETLEQQPVAEFTIRPPEPCDIVGLAALFSEMQAHYNRPVPLPVAMAAAELACRPRVHDFDPRVLLAVSDWGVAGSLVMNVVFPAFELTRALHIRDLYVARAMRRAGLGSAFVKAAARLALREGFSQLEWTTDSRNLAARKMYESCGASILDRTYYRLFENSLRAAGAP
jgi:GNAT superfamily N-acetyltransferase